MNKRDVKWQKLAALVVLTAFLVYLTETLIQMTESAYGDWVMNRSSIPERLYEAVGMFFAYVQMLILSAALLAQSIRCLVCAVRAPKSPGRCAAFVRERGHSLALCLAALFVLFFLLDRVTLGRIARTVEASEAPAALSDHIRSGWLEIGAELAAMGAVTTLVSWMRNRSKSRRERTEEADAPSAFR